MFKSANPVVTPLHAGSEKRLEVIVIGAGLCGLGAAIALRLAGHSVTVIESVANLEEVGAGLQITPNGTRLLRRWGVDKLLVGATPPETFSMKRFDGRLLAHRDGYSRELEERYGSPLWCLHRADLQRALAERAITLGANIRLGTTVSRVEPESGVVVLQSGERVVGDLILGADGLWSTSRSAMFPSEPRQQPLPTGDLAYRILVDRECMSDTELSKQFEKPGIHIWVGPGVHAVAYSIREGRWVNLVLLVPDTLPSHVDKAKGELAEMQALFEGWDPMLTKVLDQTDKVLKWRLNHLPPLPHWTTAEGRFVIAYVSRSPILSVQSTLTDESIAVTAHIRCYRTWHKARTHPWRMQRHWRLSCRT